MTTLDITPLEEQASAAMRKLPLYAQDAITKILSPSARVPYHGLPDKSQERVCPLQDQHTLSFTKGKQLPFCGSIDQAWVYSTKTVSPLTTPGLPFLPDDNSRYSLAIILQPTLLSHGWFRLEYFGKLSPSDASSQVIVVTGPIPTSNPQLEPLYEMGMAIHGQAASSGPSAAINLYQTERNENACKQFASKMRVTSSSVTITPNVDSFYDGGVVKQAVWGSDYRYRGEKPACYQGSGSIHRIRPFYQWDGKSVDQTYYGGSTKPSNIIADLDAFMSQSHESTTAAMKDPVNGGAYSIWRTDGTFTDADPCALDNPLAIPFNVVNEFEWASAGGVSTSFQPSRAPVNIITMTNLHSSCSLEMVFRQYTEIVPGIGSPINPFAITTPVAEGFDELYKEAAAMTGRCNPASANDLGTLWKKVRGFFDANRHTFAALASRLPAIGVPAAGVIEALPYAKKAKGRAEDPNRNREKANKEADLNALVVKLANAGLQGKIKRPRVSGPNNAKGKKKQVKK